MGYYLCKLLLSSDFSFDDIQKLSSMTTFQQNVGYALPTSRKRHRYILYPIRHFFEVSVFGRGSSMIQFEMIFQFQVEAGLKFCHANPSRNPIFKQRSRIQHEKIEII